MRRPNKEEESKSTSRSKRPNSKGRGRKKSNRKFDDSKLQSSETNDPAWYAASPELLRDAASIPFSWPTGTDLDTGDYYYADSVPGVAVIRLVPTIGSSTDMNSAANVASAAIYSFVRHANSGHSNYDSPDLMMYLLGLSSVYSFITWCQRLLGFVMTYDQRNRYIPRVLVEANDVDYNDLHNHIADFRFWLNTLISKVSSFAVPGVMPFFSRSAFLYSNYYIDGPTIKDQLYMYAPNDLSWLKFHINEDTSLGELIYNPMTTVTPNLATVSEIMTYGDDLFNAIWEQEDFGIMSGDIMKAYGDNIIKLAPVPEMFIMQPVYDAMFLHQFKNAKCVAYNWLDIGNIFQNATAGTINQLITLKSGLSASVAESVKQFYGDPKILSSDFDQPTPEVVIESTRLMPVYKRSAIKFYTGSEIPVHAEYWFYTKTGTFYHYDFPAMLPYTSWANAASDVVHWGYTASSFKYSPEFSIIITDATGPIVPPASPLSVRFWDIDNYAVLSRSDLEKMHTAALMSMLAVPSIAKI